MTKYGACNTIRNLNPKKTKPERHNTNPGSVEKTSSKVFLPVLISTRNTNVDCVTDILLPLHIVEKKNVSCIGPYCPKK